MFDPAIHPATFYFSGDKVVLIYIREQNALNKINPKDLSAAWGQGFEMNSRAGEEMTHIVYPKQGVAFTIEEGRIRFLGNFHTHDARKLRGYDIRETRVLSSK